jgi:hypothetical protein
MFEAASGFRWSRTATKRKRKQICEQIALKSTMRLLRECKILEI